jgi:FlaA1/EpsC-like NDP-sugar epimerase
MVRFGNVLESSGSVVPLFKEQIKSGGPITLTHPEVTRYFMSIPEAAQLVLYAGALYAANRQSGSLNESNQADVYILDMGSPVKIRELARRMIELSGLSVKDEVNPEGDVEISIIGLRPGEKLYEELLIGGNPQPTDHPRITRASEDFIQWRELQNGLKRLKFLIQDDDIESAQSLLEKLVSGYQPNNRLVDWLYLERQSSSKL